jgi:transcriptional regulator
MYKLPNYNEEPAVVLQFVRENPFAFLCGVDTDLKPVTTQVPVFIDERDGKLYLSGHIMKQTDHHKAFVQNPNVLAVFSSPHTYVSASWYENKQQASTWNYISVHARGTMRFLDEEALVDVLKRTTAHFENNPDSGANFDDLPQEYVQRHVKAIVAFEVEVQQMENVFKLSQNRDQKSYDNIIQKLEQQDAAGQYIAKEMRKRRSQLFNAQ